MNEYYGILDKFSNNDCKSYTILKGISLQLY